MTVRRADRLPRDYAYMFVALVTILCLGNANVVRGERLSNKSGSFCAGGLVHNYSRAFRKMPALRQPPPSGRLPFGPRGVHFGLRGSTLMTPSRVRKPQLGFDFWMPSGEKNAYRLNWRLRVRLTEVNRRWRELRSLAKQNIELKSVSDRGLNGVERAFAVPTRLGFYKMTVSFRTLTGRELAKYGMYARVVAPRTRVALGLAPRLVRLGDQLAFRVENRGTTTVSFGEPFIVQHYDAGEWRDVPHDLGGWTRAIWGLAAGRAGRCQYFEIPPEFSGHYRLVKELKGYSRRITKAFDVVPD